MPISSSLVILTTLGPKYASLFPVKELPSFSLETSFNDACTSQV